MKTVAAAVYDETDKTPCEAFLVMSNRKSGLPTIEKAVGINGNATLFHIREDADKAQNDIPPDIRPHFSVYRVIVVVEEKL